MDYKNGKIYKITDIAYTKMYIGSTTQSLAKRFSLHKTRYKSWQDGQSSKSTSFQLFIEFGVENCKIELIEEFPCDNRMQLERKEGDHIKNNECINKNVAGRTKKEYQQDNKQQISDQHKVYYQDNKQQILDKVKQYYQNNKDKMKENLRQYSSQRIQCECGAQYTKGNKFHHFKTKDHINRSKNIQ